MAMSPRQRVPFSAIVDRPVLKLPNDGRIIVWTIVNLEVWDITRPMPRQVLSAPTGATPLPDVANWSWHEYGMRVGFWRLHRLYERLAVKPTLSLNGRVCVDYPRLAEACRTSGWEFMGHGWDQRPIHDEEDQRDMIAKSIATIEAFTGKRPLGWLGPGLTQTHDTPENLAEAGIKYIADWVYDDEPTVIQTANGPLVTLPYTVENNDIPAMILQHHEDAFWTQRAVDAFDCLYAEGAERPRVMAIAIHPYISGQPSRIKYLEQIYSHIGRFPGVLHWTGEEIFDWYQAQSQAARFAC
jgi:allantoinase